MKNITSLLKKKILVLDGAMGTELQKRGLPQGASPELWCVDNPALLTQVHQEYIAAGSDMIYTCTFGGNRIKLAEYSRSDDVGAVNRKLARIARKTAANQVLVAGDIGPTGRFVEPFGDLGFDDAVAIFKEQVRGLIAGGVDLIVIETMMDIQEARAALIAVKEVADIFTMVTMTYEPEGRTLNGTDPVSGLITLQSLGADAVGCNCSTGPESMLTFIRAMKPYATVPLIAKPNAGMPVLTDGETVFSMTPHVFGSFARKFARAGVNAMGGCCGTTPAHIVALRKKLQGAEPVLPVRKTLCAASSARGHVVFSDKQAFITIGERINPTGKKALQAELKEGKTSLIRQLAREQEAAGARMLDVNVGAVGVDETTRLPQAVSVLSVASALPLVIDSSDPAAIAGSLRRYPGRALINSISGERAKIKKLLPLAARYGAMFILLPLTDKGIPPSLKERKAVIRSVIKAARAVGLDKSAVIVDGMIMTVSADPSAALRTCRTIKWCRDVLKVPTVVGLSNVSFGLPDRRMINSAFCSLAQKHGLTMAIANPMHKKTRPTKLAYDVLQNKNNAVITYCEKQSTVKKEPSGPIKNIPLSQRIYDAVINGDKESIKALVQNAITEGHKADSIMNEMLLPALGRVGELFDTKKYFLPQLVASAETMKSAFMLLEKYLSVNNTLPAQKKVIILATVKGDIHDIGKNIVALLLKNHGFSVIDLGKDVASHRIIREIKKHKDPIIGLSALMTTTMVNMKEIIDTIRAAGYETRFMLGGAVVTATYARALNAAYAADAAGAVKVVKKM